MILHTPETNGQKGITNESLKIVWEVMKYPVIGIGIMAGCKIACEFWMALTTIVGRVGY